MGYARSADAQEVIVVILTRTFNECTHIFTPGQEELWSQLGEQIPKDWILYGDTALGLRMGHRGSPDFELKSAKDFEPELLQDSIPFLRDATVLESARNHLKVAVGGPSPVEMTFYGGQTIAQVHPPDRANNGLPIASLADLTAEKMYTISGQPRQEDYRDIGRLIHEGVPLNDMIGYGTAVYGAHFDHKEALKNLTSVDRSAARPGPEMESTLIREGAGGTIPCTRGFIRIG